MLIHKAVEQLASDGNTIFNYNYITMIIILVYSAVFILLYLFRIYLPIKRLTKLTHGYAEGNMSARAEFNRVDELGQLANSLDFMAGEIEKLNDYQNKFIANVSHDFRSPLTSIKGYLEAMLDGTISPEMYENISTLCFLKQNALISLP